MPDSEVVRVMRQFKADLLANERTQMREMARRWLQVERHLNGNINALAEKMARIRAEGGRVTSDLIFIDEHYRALLPQLMDELDRYSDYTADLISDQQKRLIRLGIAHAEQAITTQGIRAGFNRLPVEAVQNMVGLAGNRSPLRSLLVASWPDAVEGLTQALINGVALGYNPRKVAREMARGSARGLDRMMVIARTEQLRVYRQANRDSYIASGVVEEYMRLATHDSRVCAACLMDEGHVYELGEEMPEHPQGRCTMVPKVRGVPNPTWKKGADWFVEQSPTTQTSILGEGRFDAWQAGRFDLDELVTVRPNPIWGPSLQVTTLQELTGA